MNPLLTHRLGGLQAESRWFHGCAPWMSFPKHAHLTPYNFHILSVTTPWKLNMNAQNNGLPKIMVWMGLLCNMAILDF